MSDVSIYLWLVYWGFIPAPTVKSDWNLFFKHYNVLPDMRGVMC